MNMVIFHSYISLPEGSFDFVNTYLVGGEVYPSEKYGKSIGMKKFPIYGKIKNVPNHQPDI